MDFVTALIDENDAFVDVLRGADESTPVPTCPGWTLRQLLRHVGRGHRWAAQIVDDRLTHMLDMREVRNGRPPDDGALDWLRASAHTVLDAVDRVGADTEVWTFIGPRPAAFWIRRRLHEVAVHRADAALALGQEFRLDAELAADGLTEWLERVVIQATSESSPLAGGQTLHLHAEDGGEWMLRSAGGALALAQDHSEQAAATVTGAASDLLLAATRRLPIDDPRIHVGGAADVWGTWLERTPF